MADAEHLLAEYRRSREQLAAVHRALARLTVSESSHDGAVTVTVGANGRVVDLEVHEETYRHYRPQRLAETIVSLSAKAADRAVAQAARILEPVLPPEADAAALLNGAADLRADEMAPIDDDRSFRGPGLHGSDFRGPDDDDTDPGAELRWIENAHGGHR